MPLGLRVNLVNGETHRVTLAYDDPAAVFNTLQGRGEPWHQEWVETADGAIIRMTAIVSVTIEPNGGERMVGSD